jgi:hypothetical protein
LTRPWPPSAVGRQHCSSTTQSRVSERARRAAGGVAAGRRGGGGGVGARGQAENGRSMGGIVWEWVRSAM